MHLSPYLALHAICLLVGGVIVAVALRHRRGAGVSAFAIGVSGQMLWIAGYVFEQIDETKNGMLRIVAKEFRDFLEHTELAEELRKVLTSLSFEVKTEIRFIPNDAGLVKPDVKSSVKAKRKRDSEPGDGDDGGEES